MGGMDVKPIDDELYIYSLKTACTTNYTIKTKFAMVFCAWDKLTLVVMNHIMLEI